MPNAASDASSRNAEGAQLQDDNMTTSPDWNRNAQENDTALKEKEQSGMAAGAREPRLREPLGQITSWSSQTFLSKENEDESLKYSRYRLGGSADSVWSLASSEPFDPLERKRLRSSQSECALAHSSSIAQGSTYGRHKPTPDTTQDIVDDILGDEVALKISVQLISNNNNSPGATHSMASRDIYPQMHTGPASQGEAAYLEHSPDTAPCSLAPCSRSEGLPEGGMPDGQALSLANPQNLLDSREMLMLSETETAASQCSCNGSFAIKSQESPGFIQGIKVIAALSKSAYGSGTSSAADRVSDAHKATETEESQDISVHLLQSLVERAEEINQLMKKVQIENQQQLEKRGLLSAENESFKKEEARSFKEKMTTPSHLSLDHSSPLVLQQQIASLKNQVGDLLGANEAAVLELANADEEISQLKNEMAQLKSEYLQKIKECKEENLLLKEMMNRVSKRHAPLATYEQDLHEEIFQIRRESRRLRELCHQLNEENHRLKEELWDVKREYERLAQMATARKKGQTTTLIPWTDLCKKDSQTRILSSSQYGRKEGLQTDEMNGIPSSRMVSVLKVFSPRACDERQQECSKSNASSVSMNSESTEILVTGYHDTGLKKESKRNSKDGACEEIPEPCDDDDVSAISQHNRTRHRNSLQNDADVTGRLCSKHAMSRTPVGKVLLPRRPFAPRSVTDLTVGNVVKFSRPAGKISKGTIKYLGNLLGREDVYLGVELEGSEEGKHDGTFQGTRYYFCKPNKGVFVNFSKVIMAWE
ncbi:uncharacterized protein LOC114020260 isoform X1 [Chelonia mydas]|uniref:uncharacterized protein LOC114020260 isoform X1 n=1 Tax=Chelonia mydas TaxID=8469 RepID=UPI0018A228FE|nr:uncharacterized protein LOC114020260 isoform X1 [Chelonia mydas]XP_043393944.1 uncharacterized protein LOC114020260 isoform X1 [Chelonia mydas]